MNMIAQNKEESLSPTCDCEVIHEETVAMVREHLTDPAISADLSNLFKLFSDPTRVRLLQCLYVHELCVCDLAVLLKVTKSAVSHHLRALRLANIVRFRRLGQMVYYSLSDAHVEKILSMGLEHVGEKMGRAAEG